MSERSFVAAREQRVARSVGSWLCASLLLVACGGDDKAPEDHRPQADASVQTGNGEGGGQGDGDSDAGAENDDAGVMMSELRANVTPFSRAGHDRFYGVAFDSAGSLYAVGQIWDTTVATDDIETLLAKFSADGQLDKSFGAGKGFVRVNVVQGGNGELFRAVAVQSTGKIVIAGTVDHVAQGVDARDRDIAVLRFSPDGTQDTTFGSDGVALLDLSDGVANDKSFSADSAWGIARYDDDRLVVSGGMARSGGTDTDFVLVRLLADGARDGSFANDGVFSLDTQIDGVSQPASPRNVTILPGTQGIIGAGYQPQPGGDTRPAVYKVTDAGALDTTFGTQGVFDAAPLSEQTECYQVAVQPAAAGDGYKLATTGYGRQLESETTDLVSLRLSSDGVIDPSYGAAGLTRMDIGGFGDNSRNLVVLPDRRILLVGGGRPSSDDVDGVVALLTADGAPDTTFAEHGFKLVDLGGPSDFLWAVALAPDHKTVAIAGIKGVGNAPAASANDDAALILMRTPD